MTPRIFTAIDVETANPDFTTICQVGLVRFEDGAISDEWQALVNPEDDFHPINVRIHGITPEVVTGAATWPTVSEEVTARISGQVVVCHTSFDRLSLTRAYARYGIAFPAVQWLDSARVARRAWPEDCGIRGHGLRTLAEFLSLALTHHTAVEDAKTAGAIVCRAMEQTGMALDQWLTRVGQPIWPGSGIARAGNPEGALAGEVIVFTGSMSIPRKEAAQIAAAAGCQVEQGITRRTTILVVGDQDIRKLAGHDKSSKHRKAEAFIASGQPIRIVAEGDFLRLIAADSGSAALSI